MDDTKTINYKIKSKMPTFLYPYVICYQYHKAMGIKCHLSSPQRYTEKIQWAKLNRNNTVLSDYADKVKVRGWIKEKIGEEYLIPSYGIYKTANDINFNSLPKSFVIKANHGSGYNVIVNDKEKLNIEDTKRILDSWLGHNYAYDMFEMQYREIIPCLYIEKNINDSKDEDLIDYKFFCFNGKVFCSYTRIDTYEGHSGGRVGFFDRDYKLMPYSREDYKPVLNQLPKPKNYEKMLALAEALAEGFSHVRVDFYNVEGKIYFGEMTFTNAGGICKFVPDEFDFILGKQWDINSGL